MSKSLSDLWLLDEEDFLDRRTELTDAFEAKNTLKAENAKLRGMLTEMSEMSCLCLVGPKDSEGYRKVCLSCRARGILKEGDNE